MIATLNKIIKGVTHGDNKFSADTKMQKELPMHASMKRASDTPTQWGHLVT